MFLSRMLHACAALAATLLAGCAGLQQDWGRTQAAQYAAEHGRSVPQPADSAAFTHDLLAQPLTADGAIQIALVNNPAMRLQAARLGFAAGEVYDAGRLANPVLSAARLSPGDSSAANPQLTLGIAVNFIGLLFLPANHRFAAEQFEAAKLEVGSAALDLAAQVEQGWYRAAGAEQLVQMREKIAKSARTSAELAQRTFDAGNISRRQLALEQASASQAWLDALSAQADASSAHGALNRLMGLPAAQDGWMLAARLPELPGRDESLESLQQLGANSRLDVTAARRHAQALAARYGLVRRTRLLDGVEIGVEREKDYDGAINVGPTLSLSLPLFNTGAGRAAAAQAALDQAEAELDALVLDGSNDVKRLHAQLQADRARADAYRESLIPQREAVVAQMSQETAYMLVGAFDLLAARQQEYEAYAGYLQAVRDYWITRAELALAVGRQLPGAMSASPSPHEHDMNGMPGMDMPASHDTQGEH